MNIIKTFIIPILFMFSIASSVLAGEKGEEWKLTKEESIQIEIGYMAKKLLDLSGKDSYSVEIKSYMKPFIGICMQLVDKGINVTCITPGSQAEKNGLKTGDVITAMNGKEIHLQGDVEKHKKESFSIIKAMKTGDHIKMTVERVGEIIEMDITVGTVSHPGYVLTVTK